MHKGRVKSNFVCLSTKPIILDMTNFLNLNLNLKPIKFDETL